MAEAALIAPEIDRPTSPAGGFLLAIRRASWPLRTALIRSPRFLDLLSAADQLEAQLAPLAESLVEALHARIPTAINPAERRDLLAIKRAVFNRRLLPRPGLVVPQLDQDLARFDSLIRRRSELFVGELVTVGMELRTALNRRVSEPDFQLALAASSMDLAESLDYGGEYREGLSQRDRGLYSYVCRFAAKANPLHLFASLVPSSKIGGPPPGACCEVVFDVKDLLALEQWLLGVAEDQDRVRLALRPIVWTGERWQGWLRRNGGLYLIGLRDTPLLARLRTLYDERRALGHAPSFTRAELRLALADDAQTVALAAADAAIEGLITHGLLDPYLIHDLFAPARDLQGLSSEAEPLVECVKQWHLARMESAKLSELEQWKAGVPVSGDRRISLGHYVNTYVTDDPREAEIAADEIGATLVELVPLLARESNFSPVLRVICAFYEQQLQEGEPRPYLELLTLFLRHRVEILERSDWGRDAPKFQALAHRCAEIHGEIDHPGLRQLIADFPDSSGKSLCFIGPFDFETRQFYPSNLLGGDQRFVSRYLLARRYQRPGLLTIDRGTLTTLDVELAVPPVRNLNFVVRCFEVGFGFEGRWAHGYRHWIEPEEILVGLERGKPYYLHAPSGRRLRFHHRGFLLAQYLPVEYQLLLGDHADSYLNPFDVDPPPIPPGPVEHYPGAFYRSVHLRREAWWVHSGTLLSLLAASNILEGSIALRRWMWDRVGRGNFWFFRLPGQGRRGEKPRLLDLLSPLSVMAFRRALGNGSGIVSLTRMEPGFSGLWKASGESYVAELMVEV